MIDFTLKKLILQGFRSFQDEQEFILDRKPGLYFIGGVNKKKPKLGSNAVGKSTIWDAVIWCFFGKTIEGLRGHVIKNTKSKVTKVSLELLRDGVFYTVTRTHAPNSLTISPSLVESGKEIETISQADLDQFLGLDYDKFLYTMVVGQFNSAFLELDPTVKLKIFSSIMDLSLWEKCAKAASTFSTNSTTNKNLLETKLEGIQSRFQALKGERGRQNASAASFQTSQGTKLIDLTDKKSAALNKAIDIEKVWQTNEAFIQESVEAEKRQVQKNKKLWDLRSGIDGERTAISYSISDLKKEFLHQQEGFNKWKNLTNTCPYCTQDVDTGIVSLHKKEHTIQILGINNQIKELEEKHKAVTVRFEHIQAHEIEGIKYLADIKNHIETLKKASAEMDANRKEQLQLVRQYIAAIDELQRNENPFARLTKATEEGIAKAELELKGIQEQIDVANKESTGMSFWVKGFKELRLWIMTDALEALAIETNNAISKLGLPDWRVKFQMERETSTGDISKGFHVFIHSPEFEADEYIPFKAYSGGERQRLKLGGAIGFGSLIQDYKGVRFNISVWDEPTSFLSTEGIEDLIQCLHEDAIANDKIIYIVDQRHLENALFQSVITVEMTDTGSHILDGA